MTTLHLVPDKNKRDINGLYKTESGLRGAVTTVGSNNLIKSIEFLKLTLDSVLKGKELPPEATQQLLNARELTSHVKKEAEREVYYDKMTGLYNIQTFRVMASEDLESSKRNRTPYVVALFDIDDFHEFNERYGHPEGDKVIKGVAKYFQNSFRASDIVARRAYGDSPSADEFIIGLKRTSIKSSHDNLERHLERLPEYIKEQGLPPATISMGVAEYPRDSTTVEGLEKKADENLLLAKQNGKNRLWTGIPELDEPHTDSSKYKKQIFLVSKYS